MNVSMGRKEKLLQVSFENRFHYFCREEDCILAFIQPFLFSEPKIMKMSSNTQMELIHLKTNSLLKMKFVELSSARNASDMIQFGRSLRCENFPELRTFAQSFMRRFRTACRHEQAFTAMKLIKNNTSSRLADSYLSNTLVLSVTMLTPRIEKLVKSKHPQLSH